MTAGERTALLGEHREDYEDTISWSGEDDPENPLNWAESKKWAHVLIVSFATFLVPLGATMFAPAVRQVMLEFESDNEVLASLIVSIYILGWAMGPLVLAPLSEVCGRLPVYTWCNILYVVFTIACAVAPDLNTLIVFRLLAGVVGSTPVTIGGGTISDMIPIQVRGKALSMVMLGPILGPSVGPVVGGTLTQTLGWRWIFWLLAAAFAVMTVGQIVFMRETYAVTILENKTRALRKETGDSSLRSKLDPGLSNTQIFTRAIVRPTKLTISSPINILLSLASAFINGLLFFLLTTFPLVFQVEYQFSPQTIGLSFLGIGAGNIIGLALFGLTSDRYIRKRTAQGILRPEDRLIPVIFSAPLLAIGLLWFGWSAQFHFHWIVPILGTALIGAGNILFFAAITGYLVDAYTIYAASAIAANAVLRSVGGTLLPLLGRPLYQALHWGWGSTVLAAVSLLFTPALVFIYVYGEKYRLRYAVEL
ncbi:major facilitator superfamily domain-containing protein [Aspergillus crustosus]